jgi:hypothetical protein
MKYTVSINSASWKYLPKRRRMRLHSSLDISSNMGHIVIAENKIYFSSYYRATHKRTAAVQRERYYMFREIMKVANC